MGFKSGFWIDNLMMDFLLSSHSVVLMTLGLVLGLWCLWVPRPLIGVDSGNPIYVVAEWILFGVTIFVGILASFCVWTKSLVCVKMLHRDSTIQKCLWVRRFLVPCQPFGRSSHPVRTTCHTVRTPDRPSIFRPEDVSLRLDPPRCREGSIQPASVWTFQQHVRTPISTRPVSDSFQVPIKGRSINHPDDVVSLPDARLLKARIAIQISPSRRLTAVVWTGVHQRRKLPIRLQPSWRLPIMVRTRSYQIWKLRVKVQPSVRWSPMVRTREAL